MDRPCNGVVVATFNIELAGHAMKEHTFAMDLTPDGKSSVILLDGENISGLLMGVQVTSSVSMPTTVMLVPSRGKRAELIARLPEAQIVIADEQD